MNNDTNGTRTIYVSKDGTDRNDGLTPETPKRNIENALDATNPGDTIRVGPRTYQTNLRITKNITLIGDSQNNTIIDGHQADDCIIIDSVTVTIINFTPKNGKQPQYTYNFGAGILNSGTLILEDSTITNNTANYGGGIYNYGTMTLKGITIVNNSATYGGGGIRNTNYATATIEDSIINNNTADWGGAISNIGTTMTIRRSTIANNHAVSEGGGIYIGHSLTVEDSTITSNTAGMGGGIYNHSTLHAYGCTITNNIALNGGGGIYNTYRAYLDDLTVDLMEAIFQTIWEVTRLHQLKKLVCTLLL